MGVGVGVATREVACTTLLGGGADKRPFATWTHCPGYGDAGRDGGDEQRALCEDAAAWADAASATLRPRRSSESSAPNQKPSVSFPDPTSPPPLRAVPVSAFWMD